MTIFRQEYRHFFGTLARVDAHADAHRQAMAFVTASGLQRRWPTCVDAHLAVRHNELAPERSGAKRCR
jgi:hypothetical protein